MTDVGLTGVERRISSFVALAFERNEQEALTAFRKLRAMAAGADGGGGEAKRTLERLLRAETEDPDELEAARRRMDQLTREGGALRAELAGAREEAAELAFALDAAQAAHASSRLVWRRRTMIAAAGCGCLAAGLLAMRLAGAEAEPGVRWEGGRAVGAREGAGAPPALPAPAQGGGDIKGADKAGVGQETAGGVRWTLAPGVVAGGRTLVVQAGPGPATTFVVDAAFSRLDAAEMARRVDWLQGQVARHGAEGQAFLYRQDGKIVPIPPREAR